MYSYKYYIKLYSNGLVIKFCNYKLAGTTTTDYITETCHKFPRSCYKQVKTLIEDFKNTYQNNDVEIDIMCWSTLSIEACAHTDKFNKI